MLRTLQNRRTSKHGDAGMSFMMEMLIVIAIMVTLVAVAGPKLMAYLNQGQDSTVSTDLANYATAAEASLIATGGSSYANSPNTFGSGGAAPIVSTDNKYKAFVISQGDDAGFVVYGVNRNSENLWAVSSYNGGKVVKIGPMDWTAFDTGVTPTTGGAHADLKLPGSTFTAVTPW